MVSTPTVERLGRYRLLRRIGRGGMATVYHAVQEGPHGFENEVAVKLVHPELLAAYPHILEMLVDEARIAARIRHPNVVRILDLVEEQDRFYMVMDFVDGLSMREVLDAARQTKTRIELGPVVQVLASACTGLQAAHRAVRPDGTTLGLVHRDVKPGNILVSVAGEVKVSDFGIALFGDRMAESTAHGQLKGTPAYMSPEQVMGDSLDARSDVFSMGLSLYTLATTKLAFTGDSPMKIAMKIATESLDRHADELEGILPGLGELFAQACEKEAEDRFQSAEEMGRALSTLHHTIPAPASLAEMLAGAGWKPASERGTPIGVVTPTSAVADDFDEEDDEEDTDPGLDSVDDMTSDDEDFDDESDPGYDDEDLDQDEDPTVDHPGMAAADIDSVADVEPKKAVRVDAVIVEPTEVVDPPPSPDDPELTPPAPAPRAQDFEPTVVGAGPVAAPSVELIMPGESGFQGAPPPRPAPQPGAHPSAQSQRPGQPPRPGPPPAPPGAASGTWGRPTGPIPGGPSPPGGPIPGGPLPPGPIPGGPLPPRMSAESTMGTGQAPPPRPHVQPERDYRGRVVRKKGVPIEATRVGRLEKLGVALAFFLLVLTVVVIAMIQLRSPPPGDPRFVDGESEIAEDAPTTAPSQNKAPAGVPEVLIEEDNADAAPAETATPEPATSAPRSKGTKSPVVRPAPAIKPEPEATPAPRAVAAKGSITVNTYPYSRVFVDGRDRGRTPIVEMPISAGDHSVRLVFPTRDDEVINEQVTVKSGEDAKVVHRLPAGETP